MIGHIDMHCDRFFQLSEEEIVRGWGVTLRAHNRRLSTLGGERWLKEKEDGARVGTSLTSIGAGKESPNTTENLAAFSRPKNFLDLRKI